MAEKTPKELAKKEVNKQLAKGMAKRQLEIKRLEAKKKKLEKEIKKIESGELVPDTNNVDSEDDSSSDYSLVAFLIDESGSMYSCRDETVKGFKEYIQSLKKQKVKLTLTKFNSFNTKIVYSNTIINKIEGLENYNPDGLTPLYDAIGKTIKNIEKEKAKKVLFVIMTDGMENDSKEYNKDNIKKLINEKKSKNNWTFVYLGADQDSWTQSRGLGIASGNTINFNKEEIAGTMRSLGGMSASHCCSRTASTNSFFKGRKSI